MQTFEFTFHLSGVELTDEFLNDAHEEGCDDALFELSGGIVKATFSREAANLGEAVASAINDIQSLDGVVDAIFMEKDQG